MRWTEERLASEKDIEELEEKLEVKRKQISEMNLHLERVGVQGTGSGGDDIMVRAREGKANATELAKFSGMPLAFDRMLTRVHVWKLDVPHDEGGLKVSMAVEFEDWARVHLLVATIEDKPLAYYVGAQRGLPGGGISEDDKKRLEEMPEDVKVAREVNMRGVNVLRLREGTGAAREAGRRVYQGGWRAGVKEGLGIEISADGVHEGRYVRGSREGHAVVKDSFGGTCVYSCRSRCGLSCSCMRATFAAVPAHAFSCTTFSCCRTVSHPTPI